MIVEAELKAYADIEYVRGFMSDEGAVHIADQLELDEYFAHPARDFGKTDEALRLREISTIGPEHENNIKYELTYKGPKLLDEGKSREEYTISIDDRGLGEQILKGLGFQSVRAVKKLRSIYKYKHYTLSLDDVEGLGDFVEIERIIDSKDRLEETLSEMKMILSDVFGLDKFERRSYLELLLEKDENTIK